MLLQQRVRASADNEVEQLSRNVDSLDHLFARYCRLHFFIRERMVNYEYFGSIGRHRDTARAVCH